MRLEADKTFWMPKATELFGARYGFSRGDDYDIVTAILHRLDYTLPSDKIPRFNLENCLMAFDKVQGKCVGFLAHSPINKKVFVDWVGVLPEYQRKGWATYMLAVLLWRLHRSGVVDVQAIFPEQLTLLFTRLGFKLPESHKLGSDIFGYNRITATLIHVFNIPQELLQE